ncbi:hypothetical protein [Ralstonia solanacearum]|uniref:hypothetical protein n=1 Tax=Ralstonia solanacearum TaxID=305 RepID=UPI001FF79217
MKKNVAAVGVVLLMGTVTAACPCAYAQSHEIYNSLGTEGLGIGYGYALTDAANVRVEVNGFSFPNNFTAGDLHYDAKLKAAHGALLGDYFPAPDAFPIRLTAGIFVGDDRIDGTATSQSGTYRINGATVSGAGQSITAQLKFPAVRPYLGIGFGHNPRVKGLSVAFDAGFAYGKPSVSLNVPPSIAAAAGASNVSAAEQSLQAKADHLKFSPILKAAVTYRF